VNNRHPRNPLNGRHPARLLAREPVPFTNRISNKKFQWSDQDVSIAIQREKCLKEWPKKMEAASHRKK